MSPHGDEIPRIGEESKRVGCTEHLYKNDNDEKPEKTAYSCVFCNGRIEIAVYISDAVCKRRVIGVVSRKGDYAA